MNSEQLERIKQMMVSENTDDANLVGSIIQSQLFKDEEAFNQFMELANSASLYPLRNILESTCENTPGIHSRSFKIKLDKEWFKTNDVLLTETLVE